MKTWCCVVPDKVPPQRSGNEGFPAPCFHPHLPKPGMGGGAERGWWARCWARPCARWEVGRKATARVGKEVAHFPAEMVTNCLPSLGHSERIVAAEGGPRRARPSCRWERTGLGWPWWWGGRAVYWLYTCFAAAGLGFAKNRNRSLALRVPQLRLLKAGVPNVLCACGRAGSGAGLQNCPCSAQPPH